MGHLRKQTGIAAFAAAGAAVFLTAAGASPARANGGAGYTQAQVQQEGTRISYVVFHALDRDGFCDAAAFGAVSLHPVLTGAPAATMINGTTGLPSPEPSLDVVIDSGDGVIINTSAGPAAGVRSVTGLPTFSTYDNAQAGSPVKAFPPLQAGVPDECQAWVEVASSLGQPVNVLMIFHSSTGDVGFDEIVNGPQPTSATSTATSTPPAASAASAPMASMTLDSRWTLTSWRGPDGIAPGDALGGTGAASGGTNIAADVTAVYAWDAASSSWLAYFPSAGSVPGANTLTSLTAGQPYWVAIAGSASLQWTVPVQ